MYNNRNIKQMFQNLKIKLHHTVELAHNYDL